MNMSVLDECDIEYSVDYSTWDSKFYERETGKKKKTWSLHVARKLVTSSKTLRILSKHGVISRREKLWAFITSPVFSLAACVMSAITSFVLFAFVVATLQTWAIFGSVFFLGIMLFSILISDTDERFLTKIADRIDKEFNKNSRGRVEIDQGEKEVYDFVRTLSRSQDEDAAKLKKTLFELVMQYPAEVNKQINELYKMKEGIPEDAGGSDAEVSEAVLSDVNQMLEKLFSMRDTSENLQIVNQIKHVLEEAVRQEKTEQMGISVKKLSEIVDFLSKAEQENKVPEPGLPKNSREVSALVSEMNNVDVEYETVGKDTRGTEMKNLT